MAYLSILKFLPDILSVIKIIVNAIKSGKSKEEIREGLKGIEAAFLESLPEKKAASLNDIFNKKIQ